MCLAIPGLVKEVKGQKLVVKYPTEERQAHAGGVKIKVGDYVLIQMGIVLKTVTKAEAMSSWKAWKKAE